MSVRSKIGVARTPVADDWSQGRHEPAQAQWAHLLTSACCWRTVAISSAQLSRLTVKNRRYPSPLSPLDNAGPSSTLDTVTGREVLKIVLRKGCEKLRQRGSHVMVRCPGGCQSVVPVHGGQDIPPGTLRSIERALEPCLGKGWLR